MSRTRPPGSTRPERFHVLRAPPGGPEDPAGYPLEALHAVSAMMACCSAVADSGSKAPAQVIRKKPSRFCQSKAASASSRAASVSITSRSRAVLRVSASAATPRLRSRPGELQEVRGELDFKDSAREVGDVPGVVASPPLAPNLRDVGDDGAEVMGRREDGLPEGFEVGFESAVRGDCAGVGQHPEVRRTPWAKCRVSPAREHALRPCPSPSAYAGAASYRSSSGDRLWTSSMSRRTNCSCQSSGGRPVAPGATGSRSYTNSGGRAGGEFAPARGPQRGERHAPVRRFSMFGRALQPRGMHQGVDAREDDVGQRTRGVGRRHRAAPCGRRAGTRVVPPRSWPRPRGRRSWERGRPRRPHGARFGGVELPLVVDANEAAPGDTLLLRVEAEVRGQLQVGPVRAGSPARRDSPSSTSRGARPLRACLRRDPSPTRSGRRWCVRWRRCLARSRPRPPSRTEPRRRPACVRATRTGTPASGVPK